MTQTAFNYLISSANVGKIPQGWKPKLANSFYLKFKGEGYHAAKIDLIDNLEKIDGHKYGMAADDDAIVKFARDRADECFRVAVMFKDKDQALEHMIKVAQRYEIAPPSGRNVTQTGQRMRLLNENWWRRNVRKTTARNVEAAAINIGLVSRVAGLYASNEAVERRTQQRKRNNRILSSITAENDQGFSCSMKELHDLGVANLEIRRMELMTRLAGFDAVAQVRGHAAEFYTWTAPSKYHARHHITGHIQKNYNGSTPAETQKYFTKLWSQVRAKLHREKITIYGFRVCEPHHDATPHWHLLLFCDQSHVKRLRAIMKDYAMREDGQEFGASKHRFTAEAIDRKKGSAVGYIAKYIAKNIDGHEVGEDYEAIEGQDAATDTARRVDAWASTWGIRQFQQIGGQSVTVWRELRRADVEAIENAEFKAIAEAADAGAWDRYTMLNGGVMPSIYEYPRYSEKTGKPLRNGSKAILERKVQAAKVGALDLETGELRFNQYQEAAAPKIVGVRYINEQINTHERVWTFKRVREALPARSSVNNYTVTDELAEVNQEFKKRAAKAHFSEVNKRPFSPRLPKYVDRPIVFL